MKHILLTLTIIVSIAAGTLVGSRAPRPVTPDVTPSVLRAPLPPRYDMRPHHRVSRSVDERKPLPVATRSPAPAPVAAGAVKDVTAYCATGNQTASGEWPRAGMVATLDRGIPFGTRVYIASLGWFTVTDRIGYGSDFDVFLEGADCESRAVFFGRKHLRVTVP